MGIQIDTTFLKSKVARRIFILFIFCALVPITTLSVISYSQVTKQLEEQNRLRLRRSSKSIGMSVMERLLFLENELKVFSSGIDTSRDPETLESLQRIAERLRERYNALVLITRTGKMVPVFGNMKPLQRLTEEEQEQLRSGRSIVTTPRKVKMTIPWA